MIVTVLIFEQYKGIGTASLTCSTVVFGWVQGGTKEGIREMEGNWGRATLVWVGKPAEQRKPLWGLGGKATMSA
jgi:hypothetical protein